MKIITLIMLLVLIPAVCFAQESGAWDEVLIGTSFKTLAKAYVATIDIKKLKEANIEKLELMDNEKFRKSYLEAYSIIKDLPTAVKKDYGIAESMSKQQAILNMKILDKKKMYALIDAMPNKTISQQFKQYLGKRKDAPEDSDLVGQIQKFWNKVKLNAGIQGT